MDVRPWRLLQIAGVYVASSGRSSDQITLTGFDTKTLVTVGAMNFPQAAIPSAWCSDPGRPGDRAQRSQVDQRVATLSWTINPAARSQPGRWWRPDSRQVKR